jgi:hypothetical protein
MEIELTTFGEPEGFGLPVAFWLTNIGHNDGETADISDAAAVTFRVKASSAGSLNVLIMSASSTTTSRTINVGTEWAVVTLSTAAGSDWISDTYSSESFTNFGALQLNFLGGTLNAQGFAGGTRIYIDDLKIQ